MAACGPGNSCRGNNECCCGLYGNNYNKCGTTVSFCNQYSIQNLCGPCTTSNCFDIPVQFQQFPGSFQCPQQVHEYKDCRLTNWSSCNNERRTITITRDAITGGSLNGVACPDPTNLIQTCNNCIISDWTACINRTRTRTRTQSINSTACTIEQNALSLTQTCNNCIISDWTACTVSEGDSRVCLYKTDCTNRTRTRKRTQSINSTACTLEENALPVTQTCNDCEVSEWIGTCINRTRTKATIPPINGGLACPDPTSLIQTCNDCEVSEWTACINMKRTKATIPPMNGGLACPDPTSLIQTCNDCEVDIEWTGACINRTRIKSTIPPINGGLACPDPTSLIQTCNDCIISDWTACTVSYGDSRVCLYKTDCTNRTRTRKRTQSINSTACTLEENALPVTQTCNDCEVDIEWTGACINMKRTKATIPPINGGLACPDSTSLIQTCNNCIVSDWTACINRTRTRKRTQSINSTACTLEENALSVTQTCNNCEVSEWTACVNRTRTRTRTQSINSTACTLEENALSLTQTCNNCIISDWTSCNGNNKIKTRKRTYAINGGTACTPEENKLLLNEDCYNCKIGQWANWSVWSECDCKTKTITRTKKVINNNSNCDLIQTQNCSNNEKCLKLECGAQNKYYNLQTKKCNNKNIFNYIINLFNLIILFIMNLFKFS